MYVDQVKAALRSINWLYADVNDSSIDECISNTSSKMLVKIEKILHKRVLPNHKLIYPSRENEGESYY